MENIEIICKGCGSKFNHPVREQEFFQKMGFATKPLRCYKCRVNRKQSKSRHPYQKPQIQPTSNPPVTQPINSENNNEPNQSE